MEPHFTSANLKKKIAALIDFIQLLEDPTRLRILFLFFLYNRLSIAQISELVHLTKPAISHQLKKFIDIGIIKITKRPVRGTMTANFYELIPNFLENAVIRLDPTIEIPPDIVKDMEILHIRAEKETFKLASNIFSRFAEYYNHLEQQAQAIKEPYGMHHPPFSITILPLSKKGHEIYSQEINKITEGILKLIAKEDEQDQDSLERPMMFISTFFPIKDFLSYRE